jgi:hypothetical protein
MMMTMMINASAVFLLLLSWLVCNGSLRNHERIWGREGIASSTGRFTLCENCPSTLRIGCQLNRLPVLALWRSANCVCPFSMTYHQPAELIVSRGHYQDTRPPIVLRRRTAIAEYRLVMSWGSKTAALSSRSWLVISPSLAARLATYFLFEISPASHLFLCTSLFHLSSSLSARLSTWWTFRSDLQTVKWKWT